MENEQIPNNDEAHALHNLISINKDIDVQIMELAKKQAQNNIVIEQLKPLAKYTTPEQIAIEAAAQLQYEKDLAEGKIESPGNVIQVEEPVSGGAV